MNALGAPVDAQDAEQKRRARQRRITNLGAGLLGLTAFLALGTWVFDRITHVHLSDARIAATMIAVSARVPGRILSVAVEEGQQIRAGAPLVQLDDREAALLEQALLSDVATLRAEREGLIARRAMIDTQTRSRLEAQASRLAASEAFRAALASRHERAEADWQRATPLMERNAISRQEWESLQAGWLQATSELAAAEADVQAVRADLAEIEAGRVELQMIDDELAALVHRIEALSLQRERQGVIRSDHLMTSPVDGVVDELFVDAGEFVGRGQRLLMLHDPRDLWVSANVRETDLRHIAPGMEATVTVDAYPDQDLAARLTRIGSAATSQFALLPNPNPSGNFTKITQRLELRFELEPTDLPLRPGMMVEVKIAI
jgi:membrane fusion protein (multidrug efflux system)